jgi:plastocyanin
MNRFLTAASVAALTLCVYGCGDDGNSSPTGPGGSSSAPAGAIVIDIVGVNGTRSFAPNPATVPSGQMVAWHNVDTTIHRVVLDDGRTDTGNILPGAFSAPMTLAVPGPYHCSIHPSMVGTIDGAR